MAQRDKFQHTPGCSTLTLECNLRRLAKWTVKSSWMIAGCSSDMLRRSSMAVDVGMTASGNNTLQSLISNTTTDGSPAIGLFLLAIKHAQFLLFCNT